MYSSLLKVGEPRCNLRIYLGASELWDRENGPTAKFSKSIKRSNLPGSGQMIRVHKRSNVKGEDGKDLP